MFIGDADQKATSLRPPSIKGALRFWWRALNWGQFLDQTEFDTTPALIAMHRAESELFGTASGQDRAQQSCFLIQVTLEKTAHGNINPAQINHKADSGHSYLLGQGLYHFKNGYQRTAIAPNVSLHLRVLIRPGKDPALLEKYHLQLERALLVLGLLGGLGSRSRKGFGSLAIEKITSNILSVPHNSDEFRTILSKLITTLPDPLPPFTALSKHSRIDISQTGNNAWNLLNEIGINQQLYRSWGRNGMVGQNKAEQNFRDDHNLALKAVNGTCPSRLPKRIVFGLPSPYFFSSPPPKKLEIKPTGKDRGRRASPLFIHIHRFPDGTYAAIQTLLPAVFLPPSDQVILETRALTNCCLPAHPDWHVIHNYLDRFGSRETLLP
jgi:CRISPR-associated protein Cmr1